ncbi:hypothetical protein [uncultured Sphaerochaeta sp.]|uniref:hypothetical protein n=1 Tax=uncultured Sphaerochaeta sp. TaxID=886478 RepID=UPI002A0A850D|nr:hypothetical protein [uncultured Sphaerochaeta sp.]
MDTSSSNDYKNTYQGNIFINDNHFRMNPFIRPISAMSVAKAKEFLPKPSWEGHDEYIGMCWKTWGLDFSLIHELGQGKRCKCHGALKFYIDCLRGTKPLMRQKWDFLYWFEGFILAKRMGNKALLPIAM